MATTHTPADDMIYNLISVQYHALKAAETADKYIADAHDHDDVKQFLQDVAEQDRQRALRCHEFLGKYAASPSLAMS